MPLPPVVIEIAPPESPQALRQALLDACSRATKDSACIEGSGETEEPPSAVAIVSWRDPANVRLEVARRRERQWVVREIVFDEHDAPEERWRAVGLVIGTLASVMAQQGGPGGLTQSAPGTAAVPGAAPVPGTAAAPGRESATLTAGDAPTGPAVPPPSPAAVRVPTPKATPRPVPPSPLPASRQRRAVWVDSGVIVGSALDHGGPRVGVELAAHAPMSNPGLHASVGLSYSEGTGTASRVSTSFAEAFVGLLFAHELGGGFVSAARAAAFGQRFGASVDPTTTEGPTSGGRWLGGASVGGDMIWRAPPLGFFAGGEGRWNAGTTDVQVGDAVVGTARSLGYVIRAGMSYGFR